MRQSTVQLSVSRGHVHGKGLPFYFYHGEAYAVHGDAVAVLHVVHTQLFSRDTQTQAAIAVVARLMTPMSAMIPLNIFSPFYLRRDAQSLPT